MKTSYITLASAGIILFAACCHSWAGSTEHAAAPPVTANRDTVAFVEGADAEPPALPADLPMPKSAAKAEVKHPAAIPPKESALKAATPKTRPPLQRIPKTDIVSEIPKTSRAAARWND